ncbi:hypothetical protein AB4Z21_14525 [Paenibacillus sp. MCAF20]
MEILLPAFKIAGIAIASEFVGLLMEEHGHGNKVVFVKIITYVGCAYIAMDFWWSGLRTIARAFGVYV